MKGQPIPYSSEELQWLSENRTLIIGDYHSRFAKKFGRKDVSATNLHALRKRKGWKTGRTGCYEKGNIPHPNAGLSGPNKTSFKKGHKPHNWKPVGSRRINVEGYIEVKTVEPAKWEQLHVLNWVRENGPVPEGYCVTFIDGDKLNCEPGNLELLSRGELAVINKMGGKGIPPELRVTAKLVAKVHSKRRERIDANRPQNSHPRPSREEIA